MAGPATVNVKNLPSEIAGACALRTFTRPDFPKNAFYNPLDKTFYQML
jgi:hypothetical protein